MTWRRQNAPTPSQQTMTRITGISSMATQALLADLAATFQADTGTAVALQSVGGVDAAQRVAAGEAFDLVVLASDAIDKLMAGGSVQAGSRVDLVRSDVAVAVRAGAARPDIASEGALRAAVLAAPRIGYSTGPSGVQLAKLFERWGVAELLKPRIVVPPPGVPVGTLLARGEIDLAFQQRSELMHLGGITLLGGLPDAVQIVTTFSAGLPATCRQPEAARALLAHMNSAAAVATKQRHGMAPARTEQLQGRGSHR
ncbi:ABC-type molybdate transport system, periplasmic component [Burkholderiales bacterium JOSHI_001]|nr:ABC-type molybdate transport system, periplasmic component [Burkholderiales bacterium JOSHI_001]